MVVVGIQRRDGTSAGHEKAVESVATRELAAGGANELGWGVAYAKLITGRDGDV